MKKFILLFSLATCLSLNVVAVDKVIGGTKTSNLEHPWQLSLQVRFSGHLCGASLVRKNVVLTAAHCVKSFSPSTLRLKGMSSTGEVDRLKRLPRIKSIHMHPEFDPDKIVAHDIAVIILKRDVQLNDYLGVIDIPSLEDNVIIESDFRNMAGRFASTGWGSKEPPSNFPIYSKDLMEVDVRAVGVTKTDLQDEGFREQMIREFNMDDELLNFIQLNRSNVLLTTGVVAETGNCIGDSGGPLVYYEKDRRAKLVGITSYAVGGTVLCKGLAGFTNIQAYSKWLSQYL